MRQVVLIDGGGKVVEMSKHAFVFFFPNIAGVGEGFMRALARGSRSMASHDIAQLQMQGSDSVFFTRCTLGAP